MNHYKNILIVRTDRIGDVVLTTPAIKALREHYPEAKISILVSPMARDLVEGNDCLDEVILDDRQKEHKGLVGFLKLVFELRQKKFDVAIILHTKKRTNLTCFLSGIPVRAGYKNNKFGFLLNRPIVDQRHLGEKHEAQYCLDVLSAVGVKSKDLELHLPVKEDAVLWADRFRKGYQIQKNDTLIAIHCGASDPSKRWSERRFAQLIDTLTKRYNAKIVMVGRSEDRSTAEEIIRLSGSPVIDMIGKTTVSQLMGLFMRCDLVVSNDSGPVHIAAGVETPVVSIFTRNQPGINPERWGPLGEKTRIVSVDPAQNGELSFKKARIMSTDYSELIAVDAVLEAVDSLFKLC